MTSHEILNIQFHPAGFCHMISRGYGSNFQAAKFPQTVGIRSSQHLQFDKDCLNALPP